MRRKSKSGDKMRSEKKILTFGLALTLFLVISLFILTFVSPAYGGKIISVITTHLLMGRAGGIATGIELDLSSYLLVLISTLVDTIVVLLIYPLFIMISKHQIENELLRRVVNDTQNSARRHRRGIKKYGIIGLLFFVWFPLHMTGPLAGSFLGYFLGFSHKKTLVTVILGTALAVISWLLIFSKMSMVLGEFSYLQPIFVILITVIIYLFYKSRKHK